MKKLTANDPETKSVDVAAENVARLKALFPELIVEGKNGVAVNVDVLKALVGDKTLTEAEEKYGLNWHGKRQARQLALTPSSGTLLPCPNDSVAWNETRNLMLEGDNLEVMKLLLKSYGSPPQAKVVYIDQPYNTGKDFIYPDDFQDSLKNYLEITAQVDAGGRRVTSNAEASGRFHTAWLNLMYPRVKVARSLLRDDGVLFVSIDEKELQGLRFLCNEVFGEECFVAVITVLCNPKGRSQDKYFATNHEYVVVYSKRPLPKGAFSIAKGEDQIEAEYPEEDDGGKYRLLELRNTHREFGRHNRKNLFYPIYVDDEGEVCLEEAEGLHKVLPIWDDGFEGCWTWERAKAENDLALLVGQRVSGNWKIYRKSYASGADRMLKTILLDKAFYTERGQKVFNSLFKTKAKLFQSPKSPYLLAQLFQTVTSGTDLVIDIFGGSGTTGHAVMLLNGADGGKRRYMVVQLPEPLDPENIEQKAAIEYLTKHRKPLTIAELTKERLRLSGKAVKGENPLFAGDVGFRVFKLASSNIQAWEPCRDKLPETLEASVEHLKTDRTEADILFEVLLKLGLDLCVPIEEKAISGKTVHSVGAGTLLVCLAPKITRKEAEALALGIVEWHKALAPAGESSVVFRDSAFADDVAKTNCAAILEQHGLSNVRSL